MPKLTPSSQFPTVHIVGAGLAGSEAAYFLAERGVPVLLHEMRPARMTEAHKTDRCAELVCSNSFKSKITHSAPGMLKSEMRELNSLVLSTAEKTAVPGGDALAVDRDIFSALITKTLLEHPLIDRSTGEISAPISGAITLFATGPLTSDSLSAWLAKATDHSDLYFYDAIAPIIDASSIDPEHSFIANRYGKGGEEAYINCPMNEEEYGAFIDALATAEKVPPKNFEKAIYFQGCQPIEAIAATGRESLRFGPMKPVGLTDPREGKRPFAAVQLRPENQSKTAYNMVGFQTKLKYGEQARVLRLIPALRKAEFLRMGSIHRNTYVNGPRVLRADLSLKGHPAVYLAGQITGVEGYLESSACGLLAAQFIWQRLQGKAHDAPPANTALGALLRHITASDPEKYQPMNACFALIDPTYFEGVAGLPRDEARKMMAEQAILRFRDWMNSA